LKNPISNEWCCGEVDCAPVDKQFVHRVPGGFQVQHLDYRTPDVPTVTEFIPDAETSPSVDKQYWRCHKADWMTRCFFAPLGPNA
jgi:hypothetical protein